MIQNVCNFSELGRISSLKVVNKEDRCRYHKVGQIYSPLKMSPQGLCLSAYNSLYPPALSLLYGKHRRKQRFSCPSSTGTVFFELEKRPFGKVIKKLEILLRRLVRLFFPVEIIDGDLYINVVKVEGNCSKGHSVNESFKLNINESKELCPAVFYNIYPLCAAVSQADSLPQSEMPDVFACPDHKSNISFQVNHSSNGSSRDRVDIHPACIGLDNITISIMESSKLDNAAFSFNDMIENNLCVSLLHTIYPYFLTLKEGGDFGWMNEPGTVVAQCPNPDSRVSIKLNRKPQGIVNCEVIASNNCPAGANVGDSFFFNDILRDMIPENLFFDLIPYAFTLKLSHLSDKDGVEFKYIDGDDRTHIRLTKAEAGVV